MRILLVEDDSVLAQVLSSSLRDNGYVVDHAADGQAADHVLSYQPYDLVVLDLGLPKLDGLDVLRQLRARKSDIPVMILTARDGVDDRVQGLDLGADDYLAKPFQLAELEARVRALIRRRHGTSTALFSQGALSLNSSTRQAFAKGKLLDLSAKEFATLEVLLLKAGQVVSKEHLTNHLYGWGEEVTDNAIEVCIHRLRRKLEPYHIAIRTIRGLGYLLDKPSE